MKTYILKTEITGDVVSVSKDWSYIKEKIKQYKEMNTPTYVDVFMNGERKCTKSSENIKTEE